MDELVAGSSEEPADILPCLTLKTAEDWSMNLYATFGLSDNIPDDGVGISIKSTFR